MGPIRLLVPVFGLLGSVIFFNEAISSLKLFAFSFIVIGVSLPLLIRLFNNLKLFKTPSQN